MKLLKLSLISSVLLGISLPIFAQSPEDHVNHFSLGVLAGLSVDQWNLNSSDSLGVGITTSSDGHLGYSGSASGIYSFSKHWKLKISPGIQSKELDYRIDGLHFGIDFNGTGFNDSHIVYNVKATTITMPVTVEYVWGTKKILPFISLGIAGELVLKQSSDGIIYYSNGTTQPVSSGGLIRKNNVAAVASAGIYYRATGKISFSISPEFTYSLLHDAQSWNQYSFGGRAGVFYNFSK